MNAHGKTLSEGTEMQDQIYRGTIRGGALARLDAISSLEHALDKDFGFRLPETAYALRGRLVPYDRTPAGADSYDEAYEVTVTPQDLAALDRIVTLMDTLAGFFETGMYDDAWNLRNSLVAYRPGDMHYDDMGED